MTSPYRYTPFYCEENVWHLARHPDFANRSRVVVFISNALRRCALWAQRAADNRGPVVWDYHVVLAAETKEPLMGIEIVDLDCVEGSCLSFEHWRAVTFPLDAWVPPDLQPRFRVIDADDFVGNFSSDRRHMRVEKGWTAPPPPWPPIGAGGFNLFDYVDTETPGAGVVVSLEGLAAALRASLGMSRATP